MKATIDIPEELLAGAADAAARRGVSLDTFIIETLRKELAQIKSVKKGYRVSFPIIKAKGGKKISLTNRQIEDHLFE
ncbi:MAG TPA: hypothetical protein VEK08_08235 [Planctomycetota bacterium]|nr:hypothetical protein [Planctomycetota bacterium]